MRRVDWRELYAANQAAIERAGVPPRGRPIGLRASPLEQLLPGHTRPGLPREWKETTTTVAGRTRRALVHAPADIEPGTAAPLVCMLHGCTQDAASFAAATRMNEAADRHGFIAVYPQQERGGNAQGCWNWFQRQHQARGAGEPASIAAVVRELIGTTSPLTIDPSPRLRGRPLRRRRDGRDPRGDLPGPLRRSRGALGARLRIRDQRSRRVQGHGPRRPAPRGVRPRGPRRDGRPRSSRSRASSSTGAATGRSSRSTASKRSSSR